MSFRLMFASALIVGIAAAPAETRAQIACGERESVVAKLGENFGEVRRGGGVAGASAVFELWASDKTGSWTILMTDTDGMSCVVATGEGWQDEPGALSPEGEPA
jgi:hypothetical protein